MTDQAASSGNSLVSGAAHCRRVAERALAAASERAGFVVVSGVPLATRPVLLRAIGELAAGRFLIVEIAGSAGPRLAGRAAMPGDRTAAIPPLFVVDDAAQPSVEALREVCQTAPLSPDWAAMLSVRAVLLTRFAASELAFLAPRITQSFRFDEIDTGSGEAPPPRAAAARHRQTRLYAVPRAAPARPEAAAAPQQDPAAAAAASPSRRDWRLCALLAYLIVIATLGGWYVALAGAGRPADAPQAGTTPRYLATGRPPPIRGEAHDRAVLPGDRGVKP